MTTPEHRAPEDGQVRVQLSRARGWRMPENTVRVDRSTIWGNPFIVSPTARAGSRSGATFICVPTVEDAVECYREMLVAPGDTADALRGALPTLRGKNLACWCKLGTPCHADVLLEIANRPVCEPITTHASEKTDEASI